MSSVEVVLRECSINPSCPHGPTILFSRIENENSRNFYACSACRDRKKCNFFIWEDELVKITEDKKKIWKLEIDKYINGVNHRKLFATFNEVQQLSQIDRCFCLTCSTFQVPKFRSKHEKHDLICNISDYQLTHPTEFLPPLSDAKKEAQFLFSKSATIAIVDMIKCLNIKNVLCVGVPRLFEYITNECSDMNALLLDFDRRYLNFYGPLQFCWYNMFNNHFFLPYSKEIFLDFLKISGSNLILVTDPPFGGRIEPLANTITEIQGLYKSLHELQEDFPVFFIFPYFMEPQIKNSFEDFKMLDYKVDYVNHPLFQQGPKGRKHGSPVRIFTNVLLSKITLPSEEGYKFCEYCKRWVALENQHCKKCNDCTSKDGRTYSHCDLCKRCVKPTWNHCNSCRKCAQPDHNCQELPFNQTCFHCKQRGHKKRNCPQIEKQTIKRKHDVNMKHNKKLRKK